MIGFLVIIAIIVTIIVVVQKMKRKKATTELKTSSGYEVAVQIKNTLIKNGYRVVGDLAVVFHSEGAEGFFFINSPNLEDNGSIHFSKYKICLNNTVHRITIDNIGIKHEDKFFYAIHNDNIVLIVRSESKSKDIPPLIKISTKAMVDSGYDFTHPKWLNENVEARQYVNVFKK